MENPPQQEKSQKLQTDLEFFLTNILGYDYRADDVLREAKMHNVELNLELAIQKSLVQALTECPGSLELIIKFAQKHNIPFNVHDANFLRNLSDNYAKAISKTQSQEIHCFEKFIKQHKLTIDINKIFHTALLLALKSGHGRAATVANKINKQNLEIDFSAPEIFQALHEGIIVALQNGSPETVNRMLNFAKKFNLVIDFNEPNILDAYKTGLIKTLTKMHLGPGMVSIAKQMIKLIKKYKISINLQDKEILEACRITAEKSISSQKHFPSELKMFSSSPHIEDFVKKHILK